MIEYENYFIDFFNNLEDTFPYCIDELSPQTKEGVIGYFKGHIKRFNLVIDMIETLKPMNWKILEVGSPYPFISYFFYSHFNCTCQCSDLYDRTWKIDNRLFFKKCNLCLDEIEGVWDLIIASEVFEHLPCNLIKVKEKILGAIRPNGYTLFSFPLKSTAKEEFTHEYENKDFIKAHGHLREFRGLVNDFLSEENIIDRKICKPDAYGGDIEVLLIRKNSK